MFVLKKVLVGLFKLRNEPGFFFHGIPFLFEGATDRQRMVNEIWALGRYCLENEGIEPVTSK